MSRYVVETNFFVEADDAKSAERLVQKMLHNLVSESPYRPDTVTGWTVAWCDLDLVGAA